MDGVLMDTRRAVEEAYRAAGVPIPEGMYGIPYREWMPAIVGSVEESDRIVETKNLLLPEMLDRYGSVLPPTRVARELLDSGAVAVVLTAASPAATHIVLERTGLEEIPVVLRCTPQRKLEMVRWWSVSSYIDDLDHLKEDVESMGVKFIHYVGQTEEVLWRQL